MARVHPAQSTPAQPGQGYDRPRIQLDDDAAQWATLGHSVSSIDNLGMQVKYYWIFHYNVAMGQVGSIKRMRLGNGKALLFFSFLFFSMVTMATRNKSYQ